jgi:Xaa-Pro aminopeptidase
VEVTLLRADEVAWLDAYHTEVWERVSPLVGGEALEWLRGRTRALAEGC